jgi:hypothetical protein
MENLDSGYITSFAWRIVNGQAVYQDFICKFPPTTLYFHAFFMKILPENGQYFYFRIVYYLLFALQVYLAVSGANHFYDLAQSKVNKWAVMSVCFVISLLNFSPYPWTTTDGIFFATVAFYLISVFKAPSFFKLFLIALFCVLSALSKQSFYLIPIVFLILIFFQFGQKKAIIFGVNLVVIVAGFFLWILSITTFKNFASQITGELKFHNFFFVGIHNYVFFPIKIVFISIVVSALVLYFVMKYTNLKSSFFLSKTKWISLFLIIVAMVLFLFRYTRWAAFISFDACIFGLIYAFYYQRNDFKHLMPIIVLLTIAWSASISNGYQTPILFETGIILIFVILMRTSIINFHKAYLWIALPFCIVAFSFNAYPYHEANIFELNYPLSSISPKLRFIKTNKLNFEKFQELKSLIHKYGENFIVAPSSPMTNYLFNNQSELPADWLFQHEVNNQFDSILKICSNEKNFIFVEKSFLKHQDFNISAHRDASEITHKIINEFTQIENTNHFIVYNGLK